MSRSTFSLLAVCLAIFSLAQLVATGQAAKKPEKNTARSETTVDPRNSQLPNCSGRGTEGGEMLKEFNKLVRQLDKPARNLLPDEPPKVQRGNEDDAMLRHLRRQIGDDQVLLKLPELGKDLGSDEFEKRDLASKQLVALGFAAIPELLELSKSSDKEISSRAKRCLAAIAENREDTTTHTAILRLLRNKTAQSIETLVEYLPYASEEDAITIWRGVDEIVRSQPQFGTHLKQQTADKVAKRRALAGFAIIRWGASDVRKQYKHMLGDKESEVRLRCAQAFLWHSTVDAIPTLIELLNTADVAVALQAEELLRSVAQKDAPAIWVWENGASNSKKCQTQWQEWWGRQKAQKMPAPITSRPWLMLFWETRTPPAERLGRIALVGQDGTLRYEISGFRPTDVWLGCGNRFLICESSRHLITQLAISGATEWEKQVESWPSMACQRLPNGNICHVSEGEVQELSALGESISSLRGTFPAPNISWERQGNTITWYEASGERSCLDINTQKLTRDNRYPWFKDLHIRRVRPSAGGIAVIHKDMEQLSLFDEQGKRLWKRTGETFLAAVFLQPNWMLLSCDGSKKQSILTLVKDDGTCIKQTRIQGGSSGIRIAFPLLLCGTPADR